MSTFMSTQRDRVATKLVSRIEHGHHVLRWHLWLDVMHRANDVAAARCEVSDSLLYLCTNVLGRAQREHMVGVDSTPEGELVPELRLQLLRISHADGV